MASLPGYSNRQFVKKILAKKLNHPLIWLSLIGVSLMIAFAITAVGWKAGILIILAICGLPVVFASIVSPAIGMITCLTVSYLLLFAEKFTDFPVGTIMDGLLVLLTFGFLLKQKHHPDWKIFNNSISICLIIWIGYNLMQVINPAADSKLAWIYTIRTVALILLLHYIFLYHIKSIRFLRLLLGIWIGLGFVAALYGLKQELFGFFPFEQKWLDDNPTAISLYFIGGVWRKFSIFSDPVTFAYNMVICGILCISLMTGPLKIWKKTLLGLIAATCIISMLFSGTRAAYVLIPITMVLFLILRFNKTMLLCSLVFGSGIAAIILMPTDNLSIRRFQSAFSPEYDASYNVRANNQKTIQPFIQTHPLGGGLGATGTWGQRFSPNSYLANFPPDSGYVRVAVEVGWMGLLLLCTLMFLILRTGIYNYYKILNPELKSYCLAMVLIAFALNIGNFPQEALVQYPTNVLFALTMTLIITTHTLDQEKRKEFDTPKKA